MGGGTSRDNIDGREDSSKIKRKASRTRHRTVDMREESSEGKDSSKKLGPNSMTVFKDLARLIRKNFGDVDISAAALVKEMLLLAYNQDSRSTVLEGRKTKEVTDIVFLQESLLFSRYATAAYGSVIVFGTMGAGTVADWVAAIAKPKNANLKALLTHLNITKDEVVYTQWNTADMFSPAHYLVVDKRQKAIVWAIRGSFCYEDILTDLVAEPVPYEEGYVHEGMLRAAQMLCTAHLERVLKLREKWNFRLVITGHSMGGAVAALMAVMLRPTFPDVRAFAFGTAAVMSYDVACKCSNYVYSFCAGMDLIPRLSHRSLVALKDAVLARSKKSKVTSTSHQDMLRNAQKRMEHDIREARHAESLTPIDPNRERLMSMDDGKRRYSRRLTGRDLSAVWSQNMDEREPTLSDLDDVSSDSDEDHGLGPSSRPASHSFRPSISGYNVNRSLSVLSSFDVEWMYPPGTFIYLHRNHWVKGSDCLAYECSAKEALNEIVLSSLMFLHHFQGVYEAALLSACKRLSEGGSEA